MKRALLAMLILGAAAAPAAAQGQGRMAERSKMMADSLVARLTLTGDRETQVRSILSKGADQMQQIVAQYGRPSAETRDSMRAEMRAVQTTTETELGKVLTADEMAQYRTLQTELRRGRPGGPGPNR